MWTFLRTIIIYYVLFLLFRLGPKKNYLESPITLISIIAIGATFAQVALFNDFSTTNLLIITATLLGVEFLRSFLAQKYPKFRHFFQDTPLTLLENGEYLKKRMEKAGVTEAEIIASARQFGITDISKIKYAVLEPNGKISIISKRIY